MHGWDTWMLIGRLEVWAVRYEVQYEFLSTVFYFFKEVYREAKVTLPKILTSYVEKGLYLKL